MKRATSCPAKDGPREASPVSPVSLAGSPSWASRKARALREARRPMTSTRLEPLVKGATRHHRPTTSRVESKREAFREEQMTKLDFEAAEAIGRRILGTSHWVKRIFEEFDGAVTWFG